jgi:uncharacterized protein YjgD (DUF1641 family)
LTLLGVFPDPCITNKEKINQLNKGYTMIEPITLGLIGSAFFLGGLLTSNHTTKQTLHTHQKMLNEFELLLETNKHFGEKTTAMEILNREIAKKEEVIHELEADIHTQEETIKRLMQRAQYLRESGELQQYDQLLQMTKNLNTIKANLDKVQEKHVHRFNISTLISLVMALYEDLHQEELDLLGVQQLMEEYSMNQNKEGSGGDTFGEHTHTPPKPKTRLAGGYHVR